MHQIAHTQQKVGLASAMAVVLLIIILFATLLQKLFFKYVFRDSEDDGHGRAAGTVQKLGAR